jgi:hypothetical protein
MKTDPNNIKQVVQWILAANSEADIREAIRVKCETKTTDDENQLIEAAVEEITAIGSESQEFLKGWAIAATKELVRKMIEVGDYANALRGIKQVDQLSR